MTVDNQQQIRVALVGCGQIADAHLKEIAKIETAHVVGVCDRHPELAEQAAMRFGIESWFEEMDEMISSVRPDVVHITTPVQSHAPIARQALESGVHVYLEKPFTVDVEECTNLLNVAHSQKRLIQVGHDQSYDPIWVECLEMVEQGELGTIQHIDSVLAYPIDGPFGRNVMADANHWVRQLPGGLFQNTISHPLYKITDLMKDEEPEIWAKWFSRNPDSPLPTELRVHLTGKDMTANLLFTSTTRPLQRVVRLYGTKAGCEVDFDAQTIRRFGEPKLPGAPGKIESAWTACREGFRNLRRIVWRFMKSDLHYFAGMEVLFRQYYDAILAESDPPIPYSEIERVTRLMDQIFDRCAQEDSTANPVQETDAENSSAGRETDVLVEETIT